MDQQTRKTINLSKISFGVIVTAALISFYYFYLALWPVKVMEIKNSPVKVDRKIYHRGEEVILSLDYCKHRDVSGTHAVELVDDIVVPLTPVVRFIPNGCGLYRYAVRIPDNTFADTYHLQVEIKYEVNNLRKEIVTFTSEPFIVE